MNEQPELIFFTDRDLGKKFPSILRESGINVESHVDHFSEQTKDEIWLNEIGRRGWFAITHDQRIRYKPNEIAAVKKYDVGLFIVIGKAPFSELAYNFAATLPKIAKFINHNPRPFIAKIYRPDVKKIKHQKSGCVLMWVSFR